MSASKRFIGLDVHKSFVVVAAVDQQQTPVLRPRRIATSELAEWSQGNLRPTDEVVLEACSLAWTVYDLLKPLVTEVTVAHAADVKLIASSLIKTDKRDALVLARLLAAKLIPAVWVPPKAVRELRALISQRRQLVEQRRATKSRLRALLLRHLITPPAGDIGEQRLRSWWQAVELPSTERFIAEQNLATLDHLNKAIDELESELAGCSVSAKWCGQVTSLVQVVGVGMISAMTMLSAIGDISRFATPKKLVGYAGLGVRVHQSGDIQRSGGITKSGRAELRSTLVEIAWSAVRFSDYWEAVFNAIAERRGRARAIVAVARKLLVKVWHLLTTGEADRHTEPETIARNLSYWARDYRVGRLLGLSRVGFVRRELDRLQTGESVKAIPMSGRVNRLPPPGSVPLTA
jgi:transposase